MLINWFTSWLNLNFFVKILFPSATLFTLIYQIIRDTLPTFKIKISLMDIDEDPPHLIVTIRNIGNKTIQIVNLGYMNKKKEKINGKKASVIKNINKFIKDKNLPVTIEPNQMIIFNINKSPAFIKQKSDKKFLVLQDSENRLYWWKKKFGYHKYLN